MTPDEFMRAYEAATGAHDLAATLALIADDAVYWFSDGGVHVGKSAIAAALADNFAAIRDESYRIIALRWVADGEDVAACVYRFEWSGTIDGAPASGAGRGTSVLRRSEARWLVAHEHLSVRRSGPA